MGIVFSSEGLGLFNSTLAGGAGKQIGQSNESVFVNAATGNLVIQGQDENITGLGQGLGVVRTYNSLGGFDGDNNDQWRLGFLKKISLEGSQNSSSSVVTRTTADGFEQRFTYDTTRNLYVSKSGRGADDTLQFTSGGAAILKIDGTQTEELYDAFGRLSTIESTQDHKTSITYSGGTDRATSIITKTETGTETTDLIYNASGLLEKLELKSGTSSAFTRVHYEYDTRKRLSSVTVDLTPEDNSIADGKVYKTEYTYHGSSKRIHSVKQSDGTSLTIAYEAHGNEFKVKSLTDGEGNQTTYDYVSDNQTSVTIGGAKTDYVFDHKKRLLSVSRVARHQIVKEQYAYNSEGRLSQVINGLGHSTHFDYDVYGNVTKQTDANGIAVIRTYNEDNQLLTEQIGENTSYNVYDTKQRLRFSISAEGGVVEYNYNAIGQRVSQHVYTEDTFAGSIKSLTNLETWLGSVNKAAQQRTDYTYDFRGQLNSRTTYSETDVNGLGTGTVSTVKYVYDMHGNLLQETQPNGRISSLTYDGLGRVLSKTDANQAQTSFIYNDATQTISTRYANGLWETQTLDNTGALVSLAKGTSQGAGELGIERIYRDAQGRAVATEDTEGARSYVLYDAAGRKRFTVDALGAVTKFEYDKANQVIATTQFATLVNTSNWLNAAGELTVSGESFYVMPDTEQDRQTRFVYNKAGQKAYEVDAQGYVTRFEYNAKGQLSAKTQLSTPFKDEAVNLNDPSQMSDWYIFVNQSATAQLKVEHDAAYGAKVIVSSTDGLNDGVALENFLVTSNKLTWDMNFGPTDNYQIFIKINTKNGVRYLFYTPYSNFLSGANSYEPHKTDNYLNFPLGEKSRTGDWVTVSRDLESDLKRLEPDNEFVNAHGFLYRGTGKIGAINSIKTGGLEAEVLDKLTALNSDRSHSYHYDKAGNLEYQIDAEGYATRYYYDAAGSQIATRQYITKGAIGALVESTEDRISHQFYNGQRQIIGNLDADGTLTTYEYDSNGQKAFESTYLRHVRNHTIGNPLILPTGERVTSAWTYTNTGKVQSYAQSDGTYTYYTYDDMDNVVKKEIFEDRPPSVYNEVTLVDDNFNTNEASAFTIKGDSHNSITTENGRVKFERLPTSSSHWPSISSNETYDLKDNLNVQFEITTGESLADTYFYGGLDNMGSWGSTLDRHTIYFNGDVVQSGMVRNGVGEPHKTLMHLTTNTTYIVRFEVSDGNVTISVIPKAQPELAVSMTESSHSFTAKAYVNFYNNPRPESKNSVIYFDNYSVSKPVMVEAKGTSDNFDSGMVSEFDIVSDSHNSITTEGGRVRFERLATTSSQWPRISSKETFDLKENVDIQFEVSTGESLADTYFYGGLDNMGSWGSTLDRHTIYFNGNIVQSGVVRDGVGEPNKTLMYLTKNTTYVVRFKASDGNVTITVMPKGQPELAVSITESSHSFTAKAYVNFYNNPRPGGKGSVVYFDNYVAEKHEVISSERYRYDLLGRKVSTNEKVEQYNTPVTPANWQVYDETTPGATISTFYDKEYGSDVIKLQGDTTKNGYRLKGADLKDWNSKLSNIRWDFKYNENYTVYINVNTKLGQRYLQYSLGDFAPKQVNNYIIYSMPANTAKGHWTSVERDLIADLKALEPDNEILNVREFLIRGSGLVGSISLTPPKQAQFDLAGNQSVYIDEAGNETRYFYDAKGQLRFEIDAERHVTEYQYNRFGQRTATLAFKSAISEADLTNAAHNLVGGVMSTAAQSYLSGLRSKDEAAVSTTQFNQRGLAVSKTDVEGYQTDFEYNAFAEVKSQILREQEVLLSDEIGQWSIYDKQTSNALIAPVYDSDLGQNVIELSGNGKDNGYMLTRNDFTDDDNALTSIKWDFKSSEDYIFYVRLDTPQGERYVTYRSDITEPFSTAGYVHIPLPHDGQKGIWRTVEKDVLADLQKYEPENTITRIKAFLIRGTGRIGDVSVLGKAHTELNYDKRGLRTSTSVSAGGLLQTRSSTYDAFGRVSSTTDA
ncbi:hypothetical protein L1286_23610, partial [Pseudoalteromonas sp. SMS1]|uniref:hypothetical protein n=1 Tax=Pseudoalteromonas sp. SMS1 TaxID=2908894 RepID=UPI001F1F9CE8